MNAAMVAMTAMRMQTVQTFLVPSIAAVTRVSLEMGARVQVSAFFHPPIYKSIHSTIHYVVIWLHENIRVLLSGYIYSYLLYIYLSLKRFLEDN